MKHSSMRKTQQTRDFTSGRKGIAKSGLVKLQSKSKDFTQGLL